jgi:hypothetical protein
MCFSPGGTQQNILIMNNMMSADVKCENFIQAIGFNCRKFMSLLFCLFAEHTCIPYHCGIRWLTIPQKGLGSKRHSHGLKDENWKTDVTFLVDILV